MPSSPPLRPQPQLVPDPGSQYSMPAASPPPAAAYQPKFYQHPLVSGNIPAMLPNVTSEDYQKRLLSKKPTASILSNPANPAPANGEAATPSAKSQTAEKNKVKFSDTIQVAVVPVRFQSEIIRKLCTNESIFLFSIPFRRFPARRNRCHPRGMATPGLPRGI